MPATVKMAFIVDRDGRVAGAQLAPTGRTSKRSDAPSSELVCGAGQRLVSASVPRAILDLPGSDLQSFFAEVRVHPSGRVELPKLKVVRYRK